MAKMGKFSAKDLKKLQNQFNKIQPSDVDVFIEQCAKELAARLLAKVIPRTPVGDYYQEIEVVAKRNSKYHNKGDKYTKRVNPSGKTGGTLRRGWTAQSHEEAENGSGTPSSEEVKAFANSLKINYFGNTFVVEIKNPVEYASYVEHGHRQTPGKYIPALGKQLKKSFVEGKHMLTISEQEIQNIAPNVLEAKVKKFLGECMK